MTTASLMEEIKNSNDPMAGEFVKEVEKEATPFEKELREHISPKGALGLPHLLDERRHEYGIPDGAFDIATAFDRIHVWQVSDFHGQETWGSGSIVMTEIRQEKEERSSPRGILIAAGLRAMDNLMSNGIELGHEVDIQDMTPFHRRVAVVAMRELHILVMRDGDINGSRDLAKQLRSGERRAELKTFKGPEGQQVTQHVLTDQDGRFLVPMDPWIPDDR